ncbi:MAG: 30S ribosome-binding factor RbfA [Anderseniella sp.]|nr:30S ribosome-binding factor RbfA [Anderseniella sp.]
MKPIRKAAKGPSQRQLRVGELIRHELSALFMRGDVMDPIIEKTGVTVLEVATTPDLRSATAYIRPFQPSGDGDELVEALMRHRKFIRGELTPKLQMKFMPEIKFRIDNSLDYASSIDALLADPKVKADLGPDHED